MPLDGVNFMSQKMGGLILDAVAYGCIDGAGLVAHGHGAGGGSFFGGGDASERPAQGDPRATNRWRVELASSSLSILLIVQDLEISACAPSIRRASCRVGSEGPVLCN